MEHKFMEHGFWDSGKNRDSGKKWDREVREVLDQLDEVETKMGFCTSLNGPLIQRDVVGLGEIDGAQKAHDTNVLNEYNTNKLNEVSGASNKYQRKKWKRRARDSQAVLVNWKTKQKKGRL